MRATIKHVCRRAGPLGLVALLGTGLVATAAGGLRADRAGVARAQLASAASSGSISLVSQAPAFVTNAAGITMQVKVSSAVAASHLALNLTLDSRTQARSTLRETLSGNDLSPLPGGQGSIPLDAKGLDWTSGSTLTLHVPISAPNLTGGHATGTAGVALPLSCEPPNCGGVYPLQVALFNLVLGVPLQSFITYVIVTPTGETTGTKPLKLALTVPLGQHAAISPTGTALFDSADIDELYMLATVLQAAPRAHLTIDFFPQFLEALLERTDPADKGALAALRAMATSRQVSFVPGTFTPTDLDALSSSGIPGALTSQLARARSVMAGILPFESSEFIANAPISQSSLSQLNQDGINELLVPNAGAAKLSSFYSSFTPTTPFSIPHGGGSGIASDPGWGYDLTNSSDPALKAEQTLADLASVYFEDDQANQVLALDVPLGTQLQESFLRDFLAGVSGSRILQAVTLSGAFASVPPRSEFSPQSRGLRTVPVPSGQVLPTGAIRAAAASLSAYRSMVPSAHPAKGAPPWSDLLLMSETSSITPAQRAAYLDFLDAKAKSVSHYLSLPFGRVITVTSLKATIPISILSSARVPIVAEISVGGLDVGFPHGHSWIVTIHPQTNIVKIELSARTAGTFTIRLTVGSRTGYAMQTGNITVRSTAISGVAVALTAAAALFLVVWWLRSIIQRRRKRHKEKGAALAASAMPEATVGAGNPAE